MNIFIGCSSKDEIDKKYYQDIEKICNILSKDYNLVFGVSSKGIMGYVYQIFKNNNRKICGITNDTYQDEFKLVPCDKEIVINNTFDRVKEIYKNSDYFLFFSGGIGTFSEIFSLLEEIRTYKINKKIVLFNTNNYFDDLINLINKLIKNKFVDESILGYISVVTSIEELKLSLK